ARRRPARRRRRRPRNLGGAHRRAAAVRHRLRAAGAGPLGAAAASGADTAAPGCGGLGAPGLRAAVPAAGPRGRGVRPAHPGRDAAAPPGHAGQRRAPSAGGSAAADGAGRSQAAHRPNADAAGQRGGAAHQRAALRGPGRVDGPPGHRPLSQSRRKRRRTNYVYVVDNIGRLVGVASFRDVLLSPDDTLLSDIMYTKVVAVEAEAPREEAARLLSQYDFVALPVVDAAGRLLGVISADDILDVLEEEATEDIHFMGGSTPFAESYLDTSVGTLFRSRITWLVVLVLAQSMTSTIIRNYEDVLQQVIALSYFIPLLIDTGGNSGSQAATVITRAVALGEITMKDFVTVVWRELRVSLLLGLVMAAVVFLRATVM